MNLASELRDLKGSKRQEAINAAGDVLVSEILEALSDTKSPVSGGKYKAKKKDGCGYPWGPCGSWKDRRFFSNPGMR